MDNLHMKETIKLTEEQIEALRLQENRLCDAFRAEKFQKESKKHWDLFYKRNETRFFKDRHWTTREFHELVRICDDDDGKKVLLEVGCGVGNFAFPLLCESNLFIYACDLSPRAIDFVRKNEAYDENRIKAFQCDITEASSFAESVSDNSVDIVSMIFVLSALRPDNFEAAIRNACAVLKKGGMLIFRDYGVNDMAMFRFGPGAMIGERHYVRQDGTTSYFFVLEQICSLMASCGLEPEINSCEYVHRRTVNKKEGLDVPRIFVQGKFRKP